MQPRRSESEYTGLDMVIKSYVYDIIYLAAVIVIFIIMLVVIRKKCKK